MRNYCFLRIILFYLFFFSFDVFYANSLTKRESLKNHKIDFNFSLFKPTIPFFNTSIFNTAPIITATGDQIYCPGTAMKIVTNVTITDPDDSDTDAIYIQISAGYINGIDLLSLSNPSTHPTITSSWNAAEGKLKLYSPNTNTKVTYTDFIAAIKDVVYSNSSTNSSGVKNFSISIGQANYLPRNKHFYEYVPFLGITWTQARDAAALRTYYGLQGYLATLTAADEAQLAGEQAPGAGWIGGTDAQIENTWRWVTGPEGLESGGNGRAFWTGRANGTTTAPDNYANWNNNEPNNNIQSFKPNGENYAHITAPGIGKAGAWNDLSNEGDPPGSYQPKGYIVEYGGMVPGDVDAIQISASTRITIPRITSTTPNSRCGTGSVTLEATATDGTINWYDAPTGGNLVGTGNSFTTPSLSNTTPFYIEAGCTTNRTAIIATINAIPDLPVINTASTSPVNYCQNENTIALTATASTNCTLNWYTAATGGTASSTSPTPSSASTGATNYYVSQTNTITGCEGLRAEIIVNINPRPGMPIVNPISYCLNQATIPLIATPAVNSTLNWYTNSSGGTPTTSSPTPSSTSLGTTSYFVSQTITATGCEGPRAEIKVTVNPLPTSPIVNTIYYCLNETAVPLIATAAANCTLNWYTAATGGTSTTTSPTPSTSTVTTTKYYVSQTLTATGCEGPRAELSVIINPLPVVNDINILQCDSDLIPDGKALFNLTVNNDLVSSNFNNETLTYYTSLNGAQNAITADLIANPLAFENTTPTTMNVWARVTNNLTNCSNTAKITLRVQSTNIPPNYKIILPPVCDDNLDSNGNNTVNNDKRDGIATFDMSSSKATIQGQLPSTEVYTINYYRNETDALAEINVITDISNYRNIGYPNSQDIWVRVDSNSDNACYGLGPFVKLNIEPLPFANPVIIPNQCDDNADGIFPFNTASLESDLLNGQTNVTATYFDINNNPLKDANGTLITSPFPAIFNSTSQKIKAVVTNNSTLQCYDEKIIEFTVNVSPVAYPISTSLITICDDELNPLDQDGKFAFETSSFESTILGGQVGMIVKYFDQNGNPLPSPLPNPYVTGTQNITATVENPLNTNCIANTILNFIVHPVPNVDLNLDGNSNELVCSNLSTFFVTLDAGILDNTPTTNYSYIWKKDGTDLGNNAPQLEVNTEGIYTVEVMNASRCSRTRTITVTASNIATIDSFDIVELSDVNSVTVNTSGPGDYEYSMEYLYGIYQDSNIFENVPAGIHEVFIRDKNGCGVISKEITVVGAPKYFTPNNDSYNDVWEIKGIIKYPMATVQLFDRYGKYITTLNAARPSWDGTLNGKLLPSSDYWYVLTLEKDKPEIRGHFSLKR